MRKFRYAALFCCLVILLLNNNCSSYKKVEVVEDDYVAFPMPPDTARIQFLTTITSEHNLNKRQKKSFLKTYVTGEEEQIKQVNRPFGMISKEGKIYILDQLLSGFVVIDLEDKSMSYFIPEGKGKLEHPLNCTMDQNGDIYVADVARKQVVIFDKDHKYKGVIGGDSSFAVIDVKCDDGLIFIANHVTQKIMVYSKDKPHELVRTFPDNEVGEEGFLYQPKSISVKNDLVYISDWGEFNVKVYTKTGQLVKIVGAQGLSSGTFARPKGVDADNEGNIYVLDAAFENAQIFNQNGQLLLYFGGAYKGPGYMYMPISIYIDYKNISYFKKYVDPEYELKYLIYVSNQFGPDKLTVYGRVEYKLD